MTVTGPPALICSTKRGTTLPLLPSTLPKRTTLNFVPLPLPPLASPWTMSSHDALGGAHHARRVHGLVGRDHDEARRRRALTAARGQQPRAADVVLDRLARVRFHQRHVLVRRGVEDDVGPVRRHHRVHARAGRSCRR